LDQSIKLTYNNNNINISFTSVNLINGAGNNYFYRLNGNDKLWIDLGHQRQISFSNLAPGNYRFHVKAQTEDGTWSANEAVASFSVATPFWKSGWFIFLIIIIAAVIVYAMYQYRVKQLLMLQQVRTRIATDLHDDIGSTLTNINILAELSKTHLQTPQKTNEFLTRISEEVNTSNQSLDDIVWTINTVNDSFDQIAARMRRYASEIFEATNIRCRIEFDESLAQKKLQMEQRRDVYLIFKEAVNNIYKHAAATEAEIILKSEKNNFSLMIKDNGKGFDMSVPTNRNGLKNIIARAKKWKGNCIVHSTAEAGTMITVIMPVAH
jgi:signal transduction histidine kinase